ncbi:beta-eliminating lyase [Stachybotrys elegans]|uniref:Beta-eliminating lyase n=1 Tax=Stachybotrys elegans TaxID=80388 RepID=A0A8K0SKV6_9HYPO|nr:beta-eliminating lyase [Stachybotrys elegans]
MTKENILWGEPGRTGASFDFRSDVVTTPSRRMLTAIANATLNDNVYNEDETTACFEAMMAATCGHEAAAFVITGTMANQLALRTLLTQPPYAILADAHAHIIHWEAGGAALLSGAVIQAIRPLNRRHLTLDDIKKHAVISEDIHKCPTRVISLENTTSGTVISLTELQAIKTWATDHDISVHLDGARLWEAVATGNGSLRDFARCGDLVTLDFSKNLGAPMGAMVLGPSKTIQKLKHIRKAIGGGMRQSGVLAAAARQAVLDNFGPGQVCTQPMLGRSHRMARLIADMWIERGGSLLREVETNMVWVDLRMARVDTETWNLAGRRHGIFLDGKRIVVHHQIDKEALLQLGRVMDEVLTARQSQSHESKLTAAKL